MYLVSRIAVHVPDLWHDLFTQVTLLHPTNFSLKWTQQFLRITWLILSFRTFRISVITVYDTYHILHLWHSYKPVNHIIIETLKWNMISKYPNIVLCTNTDYLLVVCTCTLFNFFNSVLYWILVTNALLMFVPLQNPIMLQNTWGSWIKE